MVDAFRPRFRVSHHPNRPEPVFAQWPAADTGAGEKPLPRGSFPRWQRPTMRLPTTRRPISLAKYGILADAKLQHVLESFHGHIPLGKTVLARPGPSSQPSLVLHAGSANRR